MDLQQIERAIDALTSEQREQLYLWLDEHYLQPSDIQLKAIIDAGLFDERIARAVADHKRTLVRTGDAQISRPCRET